MTRIVEQRGDQLWQGRTIYSAVDGPRGDYLQCPGWSGRTKYSAMNGPGGLLIFFLGGGGGGGGGIYSMTDRFKTNKDKGG